MQISRILLALVSLVAAGCFYHSARIELAGPSEAQGALSQSEIARATDLVAKIVSERGMVLDPESPQIERQSGAEHEWTHSIPASFYRGPEAATGNDVRVSVRVQRETGRYSVVVKDLDSPVATEFTESLEKALEEALATAFPSREIRVERATAGPALGP